jgi:hypothetical protein
MPWSRYPNDLTDFWRPDGGRNRTCFFKTVLTVQYMCFSISKDKFIVELESSVNKLNFYIQISKKKNKSHSGHKKNE